MQKKPTIFFTVLLILLFTMLVIPVSAQEAPTPTPDAAALIAASQQLPVITPALSVDPSGLDGYLITNTPNLTMRTGADVVYQPIAIVKGGVTLEVTGTNLIRTWWRVRTADGAFEGWVNGQFVILRGDLRSTTVIRTSEMGPLDPPKFVTFLPQTVYSEPEDRYDTYLCDIQPGVHPLLGSNRTGDWFLVIGTCTGDAGETVEGWILPSTGVLQNPSGDLLPIIRVDDPDAPPTIDGPAFFVYSQQPIFESADEDSAVVCEITGNRPYPVTGRNRSTTFYQIIAFCVDGTVAQGWIPLSVGAFQNNSDEVVPLVESVALSPVPSREPRIVISIVRDLRTAPDGAVICQIPPREYQILTRTQTGSHYQVIAVCLGGAEEITGWVSSSDGAFRNPDEKVIPVAG